MAEFGFIKEKSRKPETKPIFESIFAEQWAQLPVVFKRHYEVRAYSEDITASKGTITVDYSWLVSLLKPFLWIVNILPLKRANNIPIQVIFSSAKDKFGFCFARTFQYPNKHYEFNSVMIPIKDNLVVEMTHWQIGWKCRYVYHKRRKTTSLMRWMKGAQPRSEKRYVVS